MNEVSLHCTECFNTVSYFLYSKTFLFIALQNEESGQLSGIELGYRLDDWGFESR
jgi:hypothetical protein